MKKNETANNSSHIISENMMTFRWV